MRYKTKGVCAAFIDFEVDEKNRIHNVNFAGGCPGNRQALSVLVENMTVDEAIEKLSGIQCRNGTSCADQLAQALQNKPTK